MTGPAIAAMVTERTPQIVPGKASFRAYSAVTRLRYVGVLVRDGKGWRLVSNPVSINKVGLYEVGPQSS